LEKESNNNATADFVGEVPQDARLPKPGVTILFKYRWVQKAVLANQTDQEMPEGHFKVSGHQDMSDKPDGL
jgi:hypothetical protein